MRSPVADLLADLSSAFAASQVDWYLFGAQAAIVYGVARFTADVDVTVRTPDRLPIASLVTSLEQSGFLQRIPDPVFAAQSRVLPFVHQATRLPVDVVLAGPGIEDEFLARAARHVIDGVDVPVVDVTDLIVMKVLAGRPKDLEDVVALLRVQETAVDTRRTRHLLQLLESALAQSDLLPAFEQALARAGSKAK